MADTDYMCPYTGHKKECKKLRDRCPKWIFFQGPSPDNPNQLVAHYDCADRWQVRMSMEIAQEVRQGAAATESFRNVMLELSKGVSAESIEQKALARLTKNGR